MWRVRLWPRMLPGPYDDMRVMGPYRRKWTALLVAYWYVFWHPWGEAAVDVSEVEEKS